MEDPKVFPGKVSDGAQIAVTDRQSAYATSDLFEEANEALEATKAAVRVEPAGKLDVGRLGVDEESDPVLLGDLYRIKPVFNKGRLGSEAASFQPVEGESGPERAGKLARYKEALSTSTMRIFKLETEIVKAWRAAEKRPFNWVLSKTGDTPGAVVHHELLQKVVTLIKETMGPLWLAHPTARPVLNPASPSAVTLEAYRTLFSALYKDYSAKVENDMAPELSMDELWMVLPNDCKRAAEMLTGLSAVELSTRRADPAIGENYYTKLGTDYGWSTHYASVIMKDGGDNLTFETAADFEAPIESGMSLGFFELYGTRKPTQSFDFVVRSKQRELIKRVAGRELQDVKDPKARELIRQKVEADLRLLEARQAAIVEGKD